VGSRQCGSAQWRHARRSTKHTHRAQAGSRRKPGSAAAAPHARRRAPQAALLLLALLGLAAATGRGAAPQAAGTDVLRYVLVIDCGSSGTRM
jgi:hypothetical protein